MSIRLQILQNKHKVIHTNKTTWNYVKLIKKVTSKWFLFLNFKKNFRNLKNLFQHFSLTLIERILINFISIIVYCVWSMFTNNCDEIPYKWQHGWMDEHMGHCFIPTVQCKDNNAKFKEIIFMKLWNSIIKYISFTHICALLSFSFHRKFKLINLQKFKNKSFDGFFTFINKYANLKYSIQQNSAP